MQFSRCKVLGNKAPRAGLNKILNEREKIFPGLSNQLQSVASPHTKLFEQYKYKDNSLIIQNI